MSTKGLFPRDYRRKLRAGDDPFQMVSEFDSTTVSFRQSSPLIGTALHYNHALRADIEPKLCISEKDRFYEEDPFTHRFLGKIPHCVTPNQSRYEMDLNRPPDTTVYSSPELAWGMKVWGEPLQQFEREFCMEKWYEFHTMMDCAVEDAIERFGFAVVFDFHSYNYQRKGPVDWRTDNKPVINLGTRHLAIDANGRKKVDEFMGLLSQHTIKGEEALIQENGVFYGGYLNRRLSHLFGPKVITLSVEYKKVYMDEATGVPFYDVIDDLANQMNETIGTVAENWGVPVMDKAEVPVPDPGYTG